MIVYPNNWKKIGQQVSLRKIEDTILQILSEIDCDCLSLSGGLDSSLLFYYLQKVKNHVTAFTMGISEHHPDVKYSIFLVASTGENVTHKVYVPTKDEIKGNFGGDNSVRLFYKYVSKYTGSIIAGDGIDEFTCGYYDHQKHKDEKTYYSYLRRLQKEHLIPLDKNSGEVKVYLPYVDIRLISLFSQIPIYDKVDDENRKKIIVEMAKNKIPSEIIQRWKYGFCDALNIKEDRGENKT